MFKIYDLHQVKNCPACGFSDPGNNTGGYEESATTTFAMRYNYVPQLDSAFVDFNGKVVKGITGRIIRTCPRCGYEWQELPLCANFVDTGGRTEEWVGG